MVKEGAVALMLNLFFVGFRPHLILDSILWFNTHSQSQRNPERKKTFKNFLFVCFTSLNQWYSTFNSWRATSLLKGVVEHHKNQVSTVIFFFSIMTLQCAVMLPQHHHILIHHDMIHQHPLSQQHSVFSPFWLLGRSGVEG